MTKLIEVIAEKEYNVHMYIAIAGKNIFLRIYKYGKFLSKPQVSVVVCCRIPYETKIKDV